MPRRNSSLSRINLLSIPNVSFQVSQNRTLGFSHFSRASLSAMPEPRQALSTHLKRISLMIKTFGLPGGTGKLFEYGI